MATKTEVLTAINFRKHIVWAEQYGLGVVQAVAAATLPAEGLVVRVLAVG